MRCAGATILPFLSRSALTSLPVNGSPAAAVSAEIGVVSSNVNGSPAGNWTGGGAIFRPVSSASSGSREKVTVDSSLYSRQLAKVVAFTTASPVSAKKRCSDRFGRRNWPSPIRDRLKSMVVLVWQLFVAGGSSAVCTATRTTSSVSGSA